MSKTMNHRLLFNYFWSSKRNKIKHYHYFTIMHCCMNVPCIIPYFSSFFILLDSGFISTIVNLRMTQNLECTPVSSTDYITQAGNFMTNFAVNI